jgi:hypothetical protein
MANMKSSAITCEEEQCVNSSGPNLHSFFKLLSDMKSRAAASFNVLTKMKG